MDKTIVAKLRELGLSEKEAVLYLSLLTLDEASVQDISRIAKIERSTTYLLLNALESKGFVRSIKNDPVHYVACEPEELTRAAAKAVKAAEDTYASVQQAAGELDIVVSKSTHAPHASYFDTLAGLSTLRGEIRKTSTKHAVSAFLHSANSLTDITNTKGIEHHVILSVEMLDAIPDLPRDIRLITKERYPIESDAFIFRNLIILISDSEEFGVRIESDDFPTVIGEAFNLAWEEAGRLDAALRAPSKKTGTQRRR